MHSVALALGWKWPYGQGRHEAPFAAAKVPGAHGSHRTLTVGNRESASATGMVPGLQCSQPRSVSFQNIPRAHSRLRGGGAAGGDAGTGGEEGGGECGAGDAGGGGDSGGGAAGGEDGGEGDIGGSAGTGNRVPQSTQSVPMAQSSYCDSGPPSSQMSSAGYTHALLQVRGTLGGEAAGGREGGGAGTGGEGGGKDGSGEEGGGCEGGEGSAGGLPGGNGSNGGGGGGSMRPPQSEQSVPRAQ